MIKKSVSDPVITINPLHSLTCTNGTKKETHFDDDKQLHLEHGLITHYIDHKISELESTQNNSEVMKKLNQLYEEKTKLLHDKCSIKQLFSEILNKVNKVEVTARLKDDLSQEELVRLQMNYKNILYLYMTATKKLTYINNWVDQLNQDTQESIDAMMNLYDTLAPLFLPPSRSSSSEDETFDRDCNNASSVLHVHKKTSAKKQVCLRVDSKQKEGKKLVHKKFIEKYSPKILRRNQSLEKDKNSHKKYMPTSKLLPRSLRKSFN